MALASHAADLATQQLRVNNWFTNHVADLTTGQSTFRSTHPHYFQGLITHGSIPNETDSMTDDRVADQLDGHPTDQTETWSDVFPVLNGEVMPTAIKFDNYAGERGKGWVLTMYIKHDGVTYRRIKASGNEAPDRDSDWIRLE